MAVLNTEHIVWEERMERENEARTARAAFATALDAAVDCAVLAPSSHNCQPWALARLAGDAREVAHAWLGTEADVEAGTEAEYLVLALDRRRELDSLAAHTVEMHVSCGAYWRMLLRSLAARGWVATHVHTVEDGDRPEFGPRWPEHWTPLSVARLARGPASGEDPTELLTLARGRHTNRYPYDSAPLEPGLLAELAERTGPTGQDQLPGRVNQGDPRTAVTTRHLTGARERERFVSFLARHAGRDFKNRDAWRETHSYLRFSEREERARADGFTLTHLFGPMRGPFRLGARLVLWPPVMRLLCLVGFHRFLAIGLATTARRSPALVALGMAAKLPGLDDALRGGERLADYWLAVTRAGLVLHPLSIVLQHEDLRRAVQRELELPGRTFFLARLGRPLRTALPSPRRSGGGYRTVGTDADSGSGSVGPIRRG
ncbi:hypothetical protein [Streptomyces oceani]|uniref:hypothetical protein n=1 Tax=Streptomyces oceani TaxID=1075402 RepID=UPI00087200BA|nr:hypothetical protein [Streptomyces oceani]